MHRILTLRFAVNPLSPTYQPKINHNKKKSLTRPKDLHGTRIKRSHIKVERVMYQFAAELEVA